MTHPLEVERRMCVIGWKGDPSNVFHSWSRCYDDRSVAWQCARIGEKGLSDWQPHITEVIVEERYVTPWQRVPQDSPQPCEPTMNLLVNERTQQ